MATDLTNPAVAQQHIQRLSSNIEHVIRGKPEVVRLALTCLLAEGHLLIEDVPGTGKTSLARAMAASIDGSFRRIQFTPDLLPSDVTGSMMFSKVDGELEFRHGGVFANIVLADEINRASPKTQSALLEVMEEHQVTMDSESYAVPRPFMVVATQNPVEMDGTYRLPEAQLDRFLMRISVDYPDPVAEREILNGYHDGTAIDGLAHVLSSRHVSELVAVAANIEVDPSLQDYIIKLANATRRVPNIRLGVSPRGSVALLRAARAMALADGRAFVTPEDIKTLTSSVFAHRIIVDPEAELQGVTAEDLVDQILAATPVPQVVRG